MYTIRIAAPWLLAAVAGLFLLAGCGTGSGGGSEEAASEMTPAEAVDEQPLLTLEPVASDEPEAEEADEMADEEMAADEADEAEMAAEETEAEAADAE